ncbi:MAG: SRPBCC family protein [Nocardioides sp.]
MKVSGTSTLNADRATVFAALNDPAVLVATIPGCQRLEALGSDSYKMTVAAGVGSIKGVYDGEVVLSDHQEPASFTMKAQGAGAPGTIGAEVMVILEDGPGGGTILSYDADAVVGGMIGGVGQRMLTGVSKRMADEFFRNVDAVILAGGPAGFPAGTGAPKPSGLASLGLPPGPSTVAPAPSVQPADGPVAGQAFTAPQAPAGAGSGPSFIVGVAVGAAAALAGVIVGGWVAGRRRS